MSDRPTCGTCPHYDPDLEMTEYPDHDPTTLTMRYPVIVRGGCRLQPYPTPHKRTDEWCGQHPGAAAFVAAWQIGRVAAKAERPVQDC